MSDHLRLHDERLPNDLSQAGLNQAMRDSEPLELPPEMYELQIHDESGPDLSFEFETKEEALAFLDEEYPPRRGLDWVLIDENGWTIDGTR